MKLLKYILMLTTVAVTLAACSDDDINYTPVDPSGGNYTPNKYIYNQECVIEGRDSEQTVVLRNVEGSITGISCNADWAKCVDLTQYEYILKIKVTTGINTTGEERTCLATITTAKGDQVLLTIKQLKPETVDSHDEQSRQPAYSPAR